MRACREKVPTEQGGAAVSGAPKLGGDKPPSQEHAMQQRAGSDEKRVARGGGSDPGEASGRKGENRMRGSMAKRETQTQRCCVEKKINRHSLERRQCTI